MASAAHVEMELGRRLAQGDLDALGELYDLNGGIAYGLALHLLSEPGRAEDVVLQAFLEVWTAAPCLDYSCGSLGTRLLTIVRDRSNDFLYGRQAPDRNSRAGREPPPARE